MSGSVSKAAKKNRISASIAHHLSSIMLVRLPFVTIADLIFVSCFFSHNLPASQPDLEPKQTQIIFVFDASGSMWGQIEKKPKIEIARKVIGGLLGQIDDDIQMGLLVYGHRRKSDCGDIELMVPIGGSPADMKTAINTIKPKGKTPLIAALSQAAEIMDYRHQRSTVILISDGVDTCSVDPCKQSSELSMQGLDFTTHVIGFDVEQTDRAELQCLATTTGGLYFSANNHESLSHALNQSLASAQTELPSIIERPDNAELMAPLRVDAGSTFAVDWNGPNSRGDWVTVVKMDAPATAYNSYAYTKFGSPLALLAPDRAGEYELRYIHAHSQKILAKRTIQVSGVHAILNFIDEQAAGSEFDIEWSGPNNKGDYITVVPQRAAAEHYMSYQYTAKGSPLKLLAPDKPGNYEVRYMMNQSKRILASAKLSVVAASAELFVPNAVSVGQTFKVKWNGPDNRGDFITVVPVGARIGAYASYQYTYQGNPLELVAPGTQGLYEVRYVQAQSNSTLEKVQITVKPVNATIKAPQALIVNQTFQVTWEGPNNKGDYITIAAKDSSDSVYGSYVYTSKGNELTLYAPSEPGLYEVRYVLGGPKTVIGRQPVEVNWAQ